MIIIDKLKKLFSSNSYLKIREDSIFLNPLDQEKFKTSGWVTFENLITPSELNDFSKVFERLSNDINFEKETCFINTGCNCNPEHKSLTTNAIQKHVPNIFSRIFNIDKIELKTGGSYVIKPAHENSKLDIHQDGSFIDEEIDYSAMLWFPLVDVVDNEGMLGVISGSHLWGSTQRGFSIPWAFNDYKEILSSYIEPIKVKKGDAVVFDNALFHSSSPNLSSVIRPALLIGIAKKNAQLIYFYPSEKEGYIQKYYVDDSFFEEYDFSNPQKPDSSKWRMVEVPQKKFNLNAKKINNLVKEFQ